MFELDEAKITLDAHLYNDLDIDSIDAVDLAVKLKQLTGKRLQPEVFKKVRTVRMWSTRWRTAGAVSEVRSRANFLGRAHHAGFSVGALARRRPSGAARCWPGCCCWPAWRGCLR